MQRLSALELRQSLGRALDVLQRTGEPILLERGRKPVAVVISLEDFRERFVEKAAAEERDRVIREIDELARTSRDPTPAVDVLREARGGD